MENVAEYADDEGPPRFLQYAADVLLRERLICALDAALPALGESSQLHVLIVDDLTCGALPLWAAVRDGCATVDVVTEDKMQARAVEVVVEAYEQGRINLEELREQSSDVSRGGHVARGGTVASGGGVGCESSALPSAAPLRIRCHCGTVATETSTRASRSKFQPHDTFEPRYDVIVFPAILLNAAGSLEAGPRRDAARRTLVRYGAVARLWLKRGGVCIPHCVAQLGLEPPVAAAVAVRGSAAGGGAPLALSQMRRVRIVESELAESAGVSRALWPFGMSGALAMTLPEASLELTNGAINLNHFHLLAMADAKEPRATDADGDDSPGGGNRDANRDANREANGCEIDATADAHVFEVHEPAVELLSQPPSGLVNTISISLGTLREASMRCCGVSAGGRSAMARATSHGILLQLLSKAKPASQTHFEKPAPKDASLWCSFEALHGEGAVAKASETGRQANANAVGRLYGLKEVTRREAAPAPTPAPTPALALEPEPLQQSGMSTALPTVPDLPWQLPPGSAIPVVMAVPGRIVMAIPGSLDTVVAVTDVATDGNVVTEALSTGTDALSTWGSPPLPKPSPRPKRDAMFGAASAGKRVCNV